MGAMKLARNHAAEPETHAAMRAAGWPDALPMPQVYEGHGMYALVGREHCGGAFTDPLRWHVSVRGPGRVPTWAELVEVAHSVRPGVPFVVSVPPRSLWLNLHPHVLHLWETGDEALIREWKVNARGDVPS